MWVIASGWVSATNALDAPPTRHRTTRAIRFVCYRRHMRLHISLDDALVEELDLRAGARRRSTYIAEIIRRSLDDERRWDDLERALASLPDEGHDWDDDPAEWVRRQRRSDTRRAG